MECINEENALKLVNEKRNETNSGYGEVPKMHFPIFA